MGGVIILLSILITSLFYIRSNPQIIPVLFVTIGFGLIGFLDDYLKVVMKRSDGLFPKCNLLQKVCYRRADRGRVSRLRARGTFARGGKSNQKRHLNLRFKNPRTLCLLQI